jgi:hypothetical protein
MAPTTDQAFTSIPPITLTPPAPPIIILLTTSFWDNWQSLADLLTQLLHCPVPVLYIASSQLFDGSWNVTMAVEVDAAPTFEIAYLWC